eukprot:gnl/Spiro4/24723_TR12283_c0_g1_i1.p1 gnl/Spiro4/24723_TR12283_c0_g1~~gnl/Spiro4/24723_TR12283_c0_g1_i1.p1  ORF type:complete len:226 (+),score=35.99 gnl/Spiro4/24723_TR12283_c0_g1_i1:228-905(+)
MAAIDTGNLPLATECYKTLRAQFPKSSRVMRLRAMTLEGSGQWDSALDLYTSLVELDPTDTVALKRRICVHRARGDFTSAVRMWNEYLATFMCDVDAWVELADLSLFLHNHDYAAFCFEEILLLNPTNPMYHVRYAETLATIGGTSKLKLARSYFARAITLTLSAPLLRALYGLCAVAQQLAGDLQRNKSAGVDAKNSPCHVVFSIQLNQGTTRSRIFRTPVVQL